MFTFGTKLKLQIFGQSHSPCMGAVLDGLPSGIRVDEEKLAAFMERRAPVMSKRWRAFEDRYKKSVPADRGLKWKDAKDGR